MPPIVKNLFLSKKFVVALLTAAGAVAMYFGYNVDPTKILTVLSPFLLYIGAQGWVDAAEGQEKIKQDTTLKLTEMNIQGGLEKKKLEHNHEIKMVGLRQGSNSAASSTQAGFATLGSMLSSIIVCMIIGVTLIVACAHSGQIVLKTGQCVLDDGIFNDVLKALAQQNYVATVEALVLKDGPEFVDCALQAITTPTPQLGAGSRSGFASQSSGSGSVALAAMPEGSTLAGRAREVIAARRASSK